MYTIVLNIFFSILRFFRAILLFISQTPFLATCRIWNKQSLVLKMAEYNINTINTFFYKVLSFDNTKTAIFWRNLINEFFSEDIKTLESAKDIGQ